MVSKVTVKYSTEVFGMFVNAYFNGVVKQSVNFPAQLVCGSWNEIEKFEIRVQGCRDVKDIRDKATLRNKLWDY
ncbi:MAG: hypothetical protein QXT26_03970, partial [Thermoproteota archaeon]